MVIVVVYYDTVTVSLNTCICEVILHTVKRFHDNDPLLKFVCYGKICDKVGPCPSQNVMITMVLKLNQD